MSNLEFNSVPSDRDLIAALAIAISQHPAVLNAIVYDPTRLAEPVKIEKVKLYGGRELANPGLVLGIYPDTVRLNHGMSGYASEEPISIAQNQFAGATYSLTAHYVAELSYRVVDFDSPITLSYGQAQLTEVHTSPTDDILFTPLTIGYSSSQGKIYQPQTVDVVVLPAEEVLKDWITILRYVIRDIRYIHPYRIRSPQISAVHYETATIFDQKSAENLVFHHANIRFRLTYSEGNFDR